MFCRENVLIERKTPSHHGVFAGWHDTEFQFLFHGKVLLLRIPPRWPDGETPVGFWALMMSMLTFFGSAVLAWPDSGWWAVHVTNRVASAAAYLIWKIYDTSHLWWCPSRAIHALCALLLRSVPGDDGYCNVERFFGVVESTRWDTVPLLLSHCLKDSRLGPARRDRRKWIFGLTGFGFQSACESALG